MRIDPCPAFVIRHGSSKLVPRMADKPNTLYYGDNLDILKRYIDDESDLISQGWAEVLAAMNDFLT